MPQARDLAGIGVQSVQPAAERADPERPAAIFSDRPDAVGAQGRRIFRVVQVTGDAAAARIESIETALGPYPDLTAATSENRADLVAAQGR